MGQAFSLPAVVRVNRKAAGRIDSGHPWIFASDILDTGGAQAGAAVSVVDPRGRLLGTAHYSSTSQIALRLLSAQSEEIGRDFFLRRIRQAEACRHGLGPGLGQGVVSGTGAYRVVHAEGDLLPALIVDRYGDYLAIQTLDQGMDAAKDIIADGLQEIFSPAGIVARNDAAVRRLESLPLETAVLRGEIPPVVQVAMNGLEFHADLLHGQKTGIYLDQRENYLAAAQYAHGRALDCFTSTGGFALHIAGKCEHVEAVDSGAAVLALAERNRASNGIQNVDFRQADVFEMHERRRFSTIILDPPAFAKSRSALEGAARGYKEINLRALRLLESGGILITCSCSHHVSEAMFLEIVAQASLEAGRTVRVLERRTQARDHSILLTVPETHYLKCLILQVI